MSLFQVKPGDGHPPALVITYHQLMSLLTKINPVYRLQIWWRVLRDKRTPRWSKLLFVVLAVGYAAMPLDLIPDFIIGLGWLDDLVVLPTLAWLATKAAPRWVRQEAEDQEVPGRAPRSS